MEPPPPQYESSVPPAGVRVPCTTEAALPQEQEFGSPACVDLDGSPVWIGSALVDGGRAVHPCKVVKRGKNVEVMVSYGGREVKHKGRFDILPLTDAMEWVPARSGELPKGRRPVEGGFEEHGAHLYHALVTVGEVQVPGKTGAHLRGANAPWGGGEKVSRDGYSVLCWKH